MSRTCSGRIKLSSPVIKTESHIRRLLNFRNQKTTIRSMNRTWFNIYDISLLRIYHIKDFIYRTVLASVIKLLCCNITSKSTIQLCTRLSIHDIPDLCLSKAVISFCCNLVIRMHLHRKLVVDIKELDQKRELTSVKVHHILADYPFHVSLHELADRITGKPSVADNRIFDSHICKLPALSNLHICSQNSLITLVITLNELLSKLFYKSITTPWSW